MASTSTLARPASLGQPIDLSIGPFNVDVKTALLISRLILDDIEEVNYARKGKNRADAPRSNEEYAFQIQREELEGSLRIIDNYRIAKNLDLALETDVGYLMAVTITEQAAAEDHRAALALSRGKPLPRRSHSQRQMEDPAFSIPDPPSVIVPSNEVAEPGNQDDAAQYPAATIAVPVARPSRIRCTSCGDPIRNMYSLRGPCGHDYCRDCITNLVDACTRDESLYPPRCCGQPFPYRNLIPLLGAKLRSMFDSKRGELDVPAPHRVYCPTPSCSAFLGSSENETRDIICHKCNSSVCPMCKQPAHPGENCSENAATLVVRELARNEHWQTCPACKAIIELHQGCYHMTCRCRAQFCYLCAVQWKNCDCPQWEEGRLLDTAQRRVEHEVGDRARLAEPAMFEARVQHMANTLRQSHDCERHRWRRRNGRARCEECLYTLPDFILVCNGCALMACVRCARNRLV